MIIGNPAISSKGLPGSREAAMRAGVSEMELAQFLLQSHSDDVDHQSRATDASD